MKTKYLYQEGERKENKNCICPLADKSKCFKVFSLAPEHISRYGKKTPATSYWKIECPHLNKISEDAGRKASEMLNKLFIKKHATR